MIDIKFNEMNTIEQAAEDYIQKVYYPTHVLKGQDSNVENMRSGFIAGAEWQSQQATISSEIDLNEQNIGKQILDELPKTKYKVYKPLPTLTDKQIEQMAAKEYPKGIIYWLTNRTAYTKGIKAILNLKIK